MTWSLSEFMGLIDARSVCWGVVEIDKTEGFAVKAPDAGMFYAMLEGSAAIQSSAAGTIEMRKGDVVIVFSHSTQAVRAGPGSNVRSIDFLNNDEYGDMPRHASLSAVPSARLLCGRIKVRWPAGLDPHRLPPSIRIDSAENVIKLPLLLEKARNFGASAILTRAAALLMIIALRDDPSAQALFREANFRDPVARAIQYMELHPHRPWTVAGLASKVGMARSTFAARFLAEAGKPPMEALTEIRMHQASELLAKTDFKIAEVAERVGYNSLSAFSRRFERSFKTTPAKMRSEGARNEGRTETVRETIGNDRAWSKSMCDERSDMALLDDRDVVLAHSTLRIP